VEIICGAKLSEVLVIWDKMRKTNVSHVLRKLLSYLINPLLGLMETLNIIFKFSYLPELFPHLYFLFSAAHI
jgi:hypothetical protein